MVGKSVTKRFGNLDILNEIKASVNIKFYKMEIMGIGFWLMSDYKSTKVYEPFGTNTKTKNEKCIYLLFFLVQIEIK